MRMILLAVALTGLSSQAFSPLSYELMRLEDARPSFEDAGPLIEALEHRNELVRRQAARALGRLERAEFQSALAGALGDQDPGVRRDAAAALAQLDGAFDFDPYLEAEKDPSVRETLFESMGRSDQVDETRLRQGLNEQEAPRMGAAKALERWFRTAKPVPSPETLDSLRKAATDMKASALLRRLSLSALNHVDGADAATIDAALNDSDAQVRRLAVIGGTRYVEDASYLVRIEALRQDFTCERALSALADANEHVVLLAIDRMESCPPKPLTELVLETTPWRKGAHALLTLAKSAPESARHHLSRFAEHPSWQARVYAARAATILGDQDTLKRLRKDTHPNVIAATLIDADSALAVLPHQHYGLVMSALGILKDALEGDSDRDMSAELGESAWQTVFSTLALITKHQRHTSRDPRILAIELLGRMGALANKEHLLELRPWLADFDPEVAARTAAVLSEGTGEVVEASTKRFDKDAVPPLETLNPLREAHAIIRMQGLGAITLELHSDEAPLTVAKFVELSEQGYYSGLTFHRIVANFVLQGGSPGANEFVGTDGYIRDEVGMRSHLRGTLGISTRGRDTGDSQIFINLVDNYRLDHNYTVFASVRSGMDVVDRIQEGDTIESIDIVRR